jgi:hypothetical protein
VYQVAFRSYILFLRYRAETKKVSNLCSLILRFVGQRSRSQLLKIEQKFDKNEMLDINETWYTHAWMWEEEAYCYDTCSSQHEACVYLVSCTWYIVWKQKKYQFFVLFLEVVTLTFDLQTSISIGYLLSRSGICLLLMFVGQRSRSQLLKIEQKLDTCFASARYLKNEMSDLSEYIRYMCTKLHLDPTFCS